VAAWHKNPANGSWRIAFKSSLQTVFTKGVSDPAHGSGRILQVFSIYPKFGVSDE